MKSLYTIFYCFCTGFPHNCVVWNHHDYKQNKNTNKLNISINFSASLSLGPVDEAKAKNIFFRSLSISFTFSFYLSPFSTLQPRRLFPPSSLSDNSERFLTITRVSLLIRLISSTSHLARISSQSCKTLWEYHPIYRGYWFHRCFSMNIFPMHERVTVFPFFPHAESKLWVKLSVSNFTKQRCSFLTPLMNWSLDWWSSKAMSSVSQAWWGWIFDFPQPPETKRVTKSKNKIKNVLCT